MVLTITRDKVKCESLVLAIECIKLIPRVEESIGTTAKIAHLRPFTPVYARDQPIFVDRARA